MSKLSNWLNMLVRLIGCFISLCSVCCVRVCQTFPDYDWIFSKNCYDNPVVNQNITVIIQSWGFSAEEHYLITKDGYKILLERAYSENSGGTPVVVMPGIGMSALGFVNRGNISLTYLLGKLGYDVWLLNYRGSVYSKGHINRTTRDPSYWSFSVNELGIYDIRSTLKLFNEKTKKKAIYVGYSMGTTGFCIYSTTFPDEAKSSVKGMIGLAPVINYKGARSFARLSALPVVWPVLKFFIYLFWQGEILPGFSVYMWPLVKTSIGMYLIQTGANFIFGDDYEQMDPYTYPQFVMQLVDTAGVGTYGHYVQKFQGGKFTNYDYGTKKNIDIYGERHPPFYNLSRIKVPVSLFVGKNDWLATDENGKQLYSELTETSRCGYHLIEYPKWNHIDFLIAKDIYKHLYQYVFDKIRQIDSENCS